MLDYQKNNMKKILLSLGAVALLTVGTQAQVGYGIKAGVNLPKMTMKETISGLGTGLTTKAATNFYVSGYANIFAAPNFAIQPGLSLQGKGGKLESSDTESSFSYDVTQTTNIMSIDIPVNAVYYIPAGAGSVFVSAGPYAGFNISGKAKSKYTATYEGETETETEEEDIEFGSGDEADMKRVDFGVNFQAGYKLSNGFLINAGYGLGLANLSPISDIKANNRILSFGIGFEF